MSRTIPIVLAVCSVAPYARAQEPGPEESRAGSAVSERVVILIAGGEGAVGLLLQGVADGLGAEGLRVESRAIVAVDLAEVVRDDLSGTDVLLHAWLDASPRDRVDVYIADPVRGRVLVRHVAAAVGVDRVSVEATTHILLLAAEALREGAEIGISREEARDVLVAAAPAEAPVVVARGSEPVREAGVRRPHHWLWSWSFGAGYDASAWTRDAPVLHGPSMSAAVLRRTRFGGLGLRADALYRLRTVVDRSPVDVAAETVGARVGAVWELAATWRVAILVGPDFVRAGPVSVERAARALDAAWSTAWLATVAGDWRPTFGAPLGFHVEVGVDATWLRPRYELVEPDGPATPVFTPWPVRPFVRLGIGLDLVAQEPS